ncbi:unnamed protein product [Sphenostylis stenocarpa]|uniref:HRDC domain-containing protein n=1 Tax=Sphenostylis stenocarpa TaxID=92480 RepID=A0AA86RRX3_9FABA|nr:unnamed protein product [Sphenostylis stenocarpa]
MDFDHHLTELSASSPCIPSGEDFHFYFKLTEFRRPIEEIARRTQSMLEIIGSAENIWGRGSVFPADIDDAYEWLVNANEDVLELVDELVEELRRIKREKGQDIENELEAKTKVPFHIPTIRKPQYAYNIVVDNANKPFEHVLLEKSEDGQRFIHPLEKLSVLDFVDKENIENLVPVKPPSVECTPFKLVEEVKGLKELATKLSSLNEFAVDLEHNHYRSFQGLTCLMQISTRTEDFVIDTLKVRNHVGPYLREVFKDPTKKKVMHGADRDIVWLQRDFGIYVCNMFDTGQASRVLKLERYSLQYLLQHYCGVTANKEYAVFTFWTYLLLQVYQNADWRLRPLPDVMLSVVRFICGHIRKDDIWNDRYIRIEEILACGLDTYKEGHWRLQRGEKGVEGAATRVYLEVLGQSYSCTNSDLKYGREDTHYLLYIHDVMRIKLFTLSKESEGCHNSLLEVYKRSYDVCMQLYEKDLLTETSYLHIYGLRGAGFNAQQLAVVSALCEWRDGLARADDEGPGYVLPNKIILEIAKQMPVIISNLRRIVGRSKLPYVERSLDVIVNIVRHSMQNASSFEEAALRLKEEHAASLSNVVPVKDGSEVPQTLNLKVGCAATGSIGIENDICDDLSENCLFSSDLEECLTSDFPRASPTIPENNQDAADVIALSTGKGNGEVLKLPTGSVDAPLLGNSTSKWKPNPIKEVKEEVELGQIKSSDNVPSLLVLDYSEKAKLVVGTPSVASETSDLQEKPASGSGSGSTSTNHCWDCNDNL